MLTDYITYSDVFCTSFITPLSTGMALLNTVIDLSEETVFDKVKWIQKNGRNYSTKPSDIPLELKAYQDAAMQIPDAYRVKLLPRPDISIKSFLTIDILPNTIPWSML